MGLKLLVMPAGERKTPLPTLHQRVRGIEQLHDHALQLRHAVLDIEKDQIDQLGSDAHAETTT